MSTESPRSSHNADTAEGYQYLWRNVQLELQSSGINPQTKIEQYQLKEKEIPIHDIETRYMRDTDTLVGMFDGSIQLSDHFLDGAPRHEGPVDHAIYLDKSARPVNFLVREIWDSLSDGTRPKSSFLNIDKEDWLREMGISDVQNPDMDTVSLDQLDPEFRRDMTARLRAVFLSPDDLRDLNEDNVAEEAWHKPTLLDGKHVAIVDEVKSSGATLSIAELLLKEAIPEADWEPVYWSVPPRVSWHVYDSDGNETSKEFAASSVPVWYDATTPHGRGNIAGKDIEWSQNSSNLRQRIGKYVIGTVPIDENGARKPLDQTSKQVHHDLRHLASRFKQGEMTYVPSLDRDTSDYKARVEAYYQMPFADWIKQRRQS